MKTTFWLAEAQSSQRDMLYSLQALKEHYALHIIASHCHERPEILSLADTAFKEPSDHTRIETIIQQVLEHQVSVLLTGRNGKDYEPYRSHLAKHGVRLLTGANNEQTLHNLHDKFAFTQLCQAYGLPVVQAWRFQTLDELTSLIAQYDNNQLCVKPTMGIFAQGFWVLDNHHHTTDAFYHLYNTEAKHIHLDEFLHAYQHSQLVKNTPMLLMPYLSGQEYSIDVVCEQGEVLAAITRHKVGSVQYVGYEPSVMAVVIPLIRAFACDGIVSVQTKADDKGNHHILEINPRPSGGIGYTVYSGLDLTQLAFLYFAGLIDKPDLNDCIAKITPCKVRPLTTSVKID